MSERIDWVDVAKGITICFVVLLHSTLGVEKAAGETGWMNWLTEFTRPFRMPDFFMIAGLFLAAAMTTPWRRYFDRKILHFVYFYVLWLTINFAFKAPSFAAEVGWDGVLRDYLFSFVEPWGTLWFIYHLGLFMLVTRLVVRVPWLMVWTAAAALEIAPIETGLALIDEFAGRFVYFYTGYLFAGWIFRFADRVRDARIMAPLGLAAWAVVNGLFVFSGLAALPFVSLALGLIGSAAVVAVSVLLVKTAASAPLRWLGAHSLVVYLAFFLPMAAARTVLFKAGIITDIGTISLLVSLAALTGPVVLYALIQWTGYGKFLFERPEWTRIDRPFRRGRQTMVAAE